MDYLTTIRQMETRQVRYHEALARILAWRETPESTLPVGAKPSHIGPLSLANVPAFSPGRAKDA